MSKTIVLYDGSIKRVSDDVADSLESSGSAQDRSGALEFQQAEDERRQENAGGTMGAVGAALEGAADTLTFGGYGALADKYSAGYRDRAQEHGTARAIGEIGAFFVPGAEFSAVGAIEGLGAATTEALAARGISAGVSRAVGKTVEGAVFGVGGEIARTQSTGDDLTIEGIAHAAGLGGAINMAVDLGAQKLLGRAAKRAAAEEAKAAQLTDAQERIVAGQREAEFLKDPSPAHNDFVDLLPDAKDQRAADIRAAEDANAQAEADYRSANARVDAQEADAAAAHREAYNADLRQNHEELVARNEELRALAKGNKKEYEAAKARRVKAEEKADKEFGAQTSDARKRAVEEDIRARGEEAAKNAPTELDKEAADIGESKKSARKKDLQETIANNEKFKAEKKYAETATDQEAIAEQHKKIGEYIDDLKAKLKKERAAVASGENPTMTEQSITQAEKHLAEMNAELTVARQANLGGHANKVNRWDKVPGAPRNADLAMAKTENIREMMRSREYSQNKGLWDNWPDTPDSVVKRMSAIADRVGKTTGAEAAASSVAESVPFKGLPKGDFVGPLTPAAEARFNVLRPAAPTVETSARDAEILAGGSVSVPDKMGKFQPAPEGVHGPLTQEAAARMRAVTIDARPEMAPLVEVPDKIGLRSIPRRPADFARLSDVQLDRIGKSVITDAQKSALDRWANEIGVAPGKSSSETLVGIRDALRVRAHIADQGRLAAAEMKAIGQAKQVREAGMLGLLRTSVKLGLGMYAGRIANEVFGGGMAGALAWQLANRGTRAALEHVDGAMLSRAAIADRSHAQVSVTSMVTRVTRNLGKTAEAAAPPLALMSTSILGGRKERGDLQTQAMRRAAEVQRIARAAPDAVFQAIEPLLGMENDVALKVHKFIVSRFQYLADVAPKDPGTAMFGTKSMWKPSYADALEFSCRMEATLDPEAGLARALSSVAHPAGVDALWSQWPAMMREASQSLAMQPDLLDTSNYPRLSQLSTFFRTDLTGMNNPQKSLAVQGMFLPQPPAPQLQASSGRGPGRPGVPPRESTGTIVQNNQH